MHKPRTKEELNLISFKDMTGFEKFGYILYILGKGVFYFCTLTLGIVAVIYMLTHLQDFIPSIPVYIIK